MKYASTASLSHVALPAGTDGRDAVRRIRDTRPLDCHTPVNHDGVVHGITLNVCEHLEECFFCVKPLTESMA